jgi:transcriptional regulator with XRE-family HTH domain/tetratricopeptide (TPR) repeat protein
VVPHRPSCARSIWEKGRADDKPDWLIAHDVSSHCSITILRSYRIGHGWTLQQTVERIKDIYEEVYGTASLLSHQRLSSWEKGIDAPSAKYQDILCRLYATRLDRLGLGSDYTPEKGHISIPELDSNNATLRLEDDNKVDSASDIAPPDTAARQVSWYSGHSEWSLKSHSRSESAPSFASSILSREIDTYLETQSVGISTVEYWESLALEYGQIQLVASPNEFLPRLRDDIAAVFALIHRRQPLEVQRRLIRVIGQMAGIIACEVDVTGDRVKADRWFHTARLAADESDDSHLRAWVLANQAMSCLWYGRSPRTAVQLAQSAQGIAGRGPNPASALAAGMEARAYALLHDAHAAKEALERAEHTYGLLGEHQIKPSVLGIHEQILLYCRGNTLTLLAEYEAALDTHAQAIKMASGRMDTALCLIDQAVCLASLDNIGDAIQRIRQAMVDLPPESRQGLPRYRLNQVMALDPARPMNNILCAEISKYSLKGTAEKDRATLPALRKGLE